jgi:hypothetical protein
MERLMAGDPADPIEIPTIDLTQYAQYMTDPACKGMAFRPVDPITEWADANPGSVLDQRKPGEREAYHRGIMAAIEEQQRNRADQKTR